MYENYSVALCTYNGELYIEEQLNSIIRQSIKPSEIVVGDDGSSDSTLEIVERVMQDSGIEYKIVHNKESRGVSMNFLYTISLCKYSITFTSDQDDVWDSRKAEKMLKIFNTIPNTLLVFCDGYLVDKNLVKLNGSVFSSVGISERQINNQDWIKVLVKKSIVTGAGMAIKTNLIDNIDCIPKLWYHDGYLSWIAAAKNGLYAVPEKLYLYRQHGNNVAGMQSNSFQDKIKLYFSSMRKVQTTRNIHYQRYFSLLQSIRIFLTENQSASLNNCVAFWKELSELDGNSFTKQIIIILKNSNNYMKYHTGVRGIFKDLLSSLFNRFNISLR